MAGSGMIVSILQLMGFPIAKPVHSRAEETPRNDSSKEPVEAQSVTKDTRASSTRRDKVNAKSGKDPKSKAAGDCMRVARLRCSYTLHR